MPTCRVSVLLWGLFLFFLSSCNITPSLGLERNVFLRTGPWFPTDLPVFVFFFFFFSILFIYLFWVVVGLRCYTGLFSSCREQELLSRCRVRASRCTGFSCQGALALGQESRGTCGPWAQSSQLPGPGAQAQSSWRMGLVAPQRGGSSQSSDGSHASRAGRRIPLPLSRQGSPDLRFLKTACSRPQFFLPRYCLHSPEVLSVETSRRRVFLSPLCLLKCGLSHFFLTKRFL